jgi:hypothetical protein
MSRKYNVERISYKFSDVIHLYVRAHSVRLEGKNACDDCCIIEHYLHGSEGSLSLLERRFDSAWNPLKLGVYCFAP